MPHYKVTLIKSETYYDIEAKSADEATDIAIDYYMNDKTAFCDDKIDEIICEELAI